MEEETKEKAGQNSEIEVMLDLAGLKTSLKAEVDIKDVKQILSSFFSDIESNIEKIKKINEKLGKLPTVPIQPREIKETPKIASPTFISADEPIVNIANDLGTDGNTVKNSKIVAFKAGVNKPQIIGHNKFSPENVALVILYSFEIGFGQHFVSYQVADEVFQNCHKKVGHLATRVIPSLKQRNLIDKKKYDTNKELTLSPNGLEIARKIIKKEIGIK